MPIRDLIKGNKIFRNESFPDYKKDMDETIKHGQKPEVLFISCCDSRVTPDLMLNTRPGDMFILRNVGNFVPQYKHDEDYHGSAAAIEYAVSVLGVKNIIVCGHSHCGACESLYKDIPNTKELAHVKTWLKLGEEAKAITLKNANFSTKEEMYKETEKNSIKYQLKNLLTYPAVQEKVKNKELIIHGWYYTLEDGTLSYYDENSNNFFPLEDLLI